jgi:hypothetical protein
MEYLKTSERFDHFQSNTKRGVFVVVVLDLEGPAKNKMLDIK